MALCPVLPLHFVVLVQLRSALLASWEMSVDLYNKNCYNVGAPKDTMLGLDPMYMERIH